MKIFDCFTFHNEFDILELRLKEHWDHVDYFVIAEANLTHQGNPKEFLLEQNWDRFKDYHEKIIHIKVDDMPVNPDPWVLEHFQRNALARGLDLATDQDIIAVSDCDEILKKSTWHTIREDTENSIWACKSFMFQFKLNYLLISEIAPHRYTTFNMIWRGGKQISPQIIRATRDRLPRSARIIDHAGWHFSYLGDTEFAANKLISYAHHEHAHLSKYIDVEKSIEHKRGLNPMTWERFEYIIIDDYFPETVLNDLSRWYTYVIPDAKITMKEIKI
jgi:hypothetical protein